MKSITNNPELRIGTILQAARVRLGKTRGDIAAAAGVSTRMVSMWERDKRGIGRGKGLARTEQIFAAYALEEKEREEVVRRITLRKQDYVASSLSKLVQGEKPSKRKKKILDDIPDEKQVLILLMALPPAKRQWVIQTANAHIALK